MRRRPRWLSRALRRPAPSHDDERRAGGQQGHGDDCPCAAPTTTAVGGEAVVAAVREIMASLFDPQILADRAALAIPGAPTGGVLVQAVVPVLRSGLAFSADPARAHDVVFVAAAFGHGADLWTGPPSDAYLVDRVTAEVVEARVRAKDAEVVVRNGVATVVALPAERRHARVLSDDEAGQVGRVAVAVEQCLGGPQIVDWGFDLTGDVLVRRAHPLAMPDSAGNGW